MDLLCGYNSSDEDESSESSDTETSDMLSKSSETKKSLLPSPDEVLNKSAKTSVFKNHFHSETNQSQVLEKHVKMVENKKNITEVNGKKVCWMYRQGRCRFGRKCKMFHDSDLRDNFLRNASKSKTEVTPPENGGHNTSLSDASGKSTFTKKRYGVTDTLEPPKKALKQIKQIKANEGKR